MLYSDENNTKFLEGIVGEKCFYELGMVFKVLFAAYVLCQKCVISILMSILSKRPLCAMSMRSYYLEKAVISK